MPESREGRELSGLARSIDALFAPRTPPSVTGPEVADEASSAPPDSEAPLDLGGWDAHAPESAVDVPVDLAPVEVVSAEVPVEVAPIEDAPPEFAPLEPEVAHIDVEPVEVPPLEPVSVEPEPVEVAPFGFAPVVPEPVPAEPVSFEPGPVATLADQTALAASSAGDLAGLVEAFLAGDREAAGEARRVAASLQEKLALDPLADALERLAHAAGDPPDVEILDLAQDIMHPAVASRIVQRIGNERDEERRASYVQVSKRLGKPMALAFKGALTGATDDTARRAYYDNLLALGDVSRPIIEAMVEDDNRFLVRNGVALLGELGGERATGLVTSALADTDPRVRKEALLALAKVGDETSAPLVLGLLDDGDKDVRLAAAVAAGELGVERAQRRLIAMLDETEEADARVTVLRALGQLADPGAVQAIEKLAVRSLFSKQPTEVRIAAYQALHRIGTPHARQLIQAALSDKDPAVQAAVRKLLR